MTQRKWVYVVDHRSPRENKPNSFANFIFPNQVEEKQKGYLTAGTHGADFGELRALEKSIRDPQLDYGGVLHYRRAPLLSDIHLAEVELFSNAVGHFIPIWSWVESSALGWSDETLLDLSAKNQTVLSKPIDVRNWGVANLYDEYLSTLDKQTFLELVKSWEFAEEFFEFLKSETKMVPFNIILSTREVRVSFFDWLMAIINPLESALSKLSSDPVQKRWPGYLAERLATFYWYKNQNKIKPYFADTLRLDFAAEAVNPIGIDDYENISKSIKMNLILKTESENSIEALKLEIGALKLEIESKNRELSEIMNSLSWKMTKLARKAAGLF